MKRILGILCCVGLFLVLQPLSHAATINFDSLADSDIVTTQFPGLTFSNTIVFTEGITLNEFELPPHSSPNVAFDNGGPITIVFDTPQSVVSGFFTYATPLTFTAFDTASNILDMVTSAFNSNLGRLEGTKLHTLRGMRQPYAVLTSLLSPRAMAWA